LISRCNFLFLLTKVGNFSLINPQLTFYSVISLMPPKRLCKIFWDTKMWGLFRNSPTTCKSGGTQLPSPPCSTTPVLNITEI